MARRVRTGDGQDWDVISFCEFAGAADAGWGFICVNGDMTRTFLADQPLGDLPEQVLVAAVEAADAFNLERAGLWAPRRPNQAFRVRTRGNIEEQQGLASRYLREGVEVEVQSREGTSVTARIVGEYGAGWWTGRVVGAMPRDDNFRVGSLVAFHHLHIYGIAT